MVLLVYDRNCTVKCNTKNESFEQKIKANIPFEVSEEVAEKILKNPQFKLAEEKQKKKKGVE